jgi:pimeloyl-ACP methyl ester carboxylesterase
MARDAIAFLAAMGFSQADLLGFSIGSFVAQPITLTQPRSGSRRSRGR